MAAGYFRPSSIVPVSTLSGIQAMSAGSTGVTQRFAMFIPDATTMTADQTFAIEMPFPPVIPSGQLKMRLRSYANAASGVVKFNPKWASCAAGENPGDFTLNAEGTQTITWATGNEWDMLVTSVTLDADTPVANEVLIMNLVFEDNNTTLAVASYHIIEFYWE